MGSIIINVDRKKDAKFLIELASRMGFYARVFSLQEQENVAMINAIKKGKKGKYVSRSAVMKVLKK